MRLFPLIVACCLATGTLAAHRAFVASYGSDRNGPAFECSLVAPCRTFVTAIAHVDSGGEVVALDGAGYGPVTITKSVTITTNPGYYAGVSASSGNAITIDGADIEVILRGLDINGQGAASGISVVQGGSLAVENCVVSNFREHGIRVNAPARIQIVDTIVRANGFAQFGAYDGIWMSGGATGGMRKVRMIGNARAGLTLQVSPGAATSVVVTDSSAFFNFDTGFWAVNLGDFQGHPIDGFARITVIGTSAAGNGEGFRSQGFGTSMAVGYSSATGGHAGFRNVEGDTFETFGNNLVGHNPAPVSGIPPAVPLE